MTENNLKSNFTPIAEKNLSLGTASKSNVALFGKVKDAAENNPQIYDYFGVPNVNYVLPLSSLLVGRIANLRKVPEFNYTERGIAVVDDQYFPNMFPQMDAEIIERLEVSSILKIISRGITNMESFLSIDSKNAKKLHKELNNFYHILSQADKAIYISFYASSIFYIELRIKMIRNELQMICEALDLKYETLGLGDYKEYLDEISRKKIENHADIERLGYVRKRAYMWVSDQSKLLDTLSTIVSFNNIAAAFNDKYCADSERWKGHSQ